MPDDLKDSNDDALALAFRNGDEQAFEELIARHQGRIFAVAYRFTHNREDALDVAQDVFIKVHRKIGAWKPTGSFSAWLLRLTTNQAIDHARRVRRFGMRSAGGASRAELPGELPTSEAHGTDRRAGASEIDERVQEALGSLSPSQRTVFVLRHYEGMKLSEIAPVLECSVGSVKVHLFRAMKKLRICLQDLDR